MRAQTPRSPHSRFEVLDGMRGIAAICVMLEHFTAFSPLPIVQNSPLAVDLFFMLSGFVILHSYGVRLRSHMSAGDYILRRLVRLYPMFIIGLVIGALVTYLEFRAGENTCGPQCLIGALFYNSAFIPFFQRYDFVNLGDASFPTGELFPLDTPAWSLFFEMVGSFAFLWLCRVPVKTLARIAIISFLAIVGIGAVTALMEHRKTVEFNLGWGEERFLGGFARVFFGFCVGMMIYLARKTKQSQYVETRLSVYLRSPYILYFILPVIFEIPYQFKGLYPAFVLILIAPAIVYAGSSIKEMSPVTLNVSKALGWISYPLYCLHVPVAHGVFLFAHQTHRSSAFAIKTSIVLSLLLSIVIGRWLDEPLRGFFNSLLSGIRAPSVATSNSN